MTPRCVLLLGLLVLVLCVYQTRADISVHCLHSNVAGIWKFYETKTIIPDQRNLEERIFLWCNKTDSAIMKAHPFIKETRVFLTAPNKAFLLTDDYDLAKNQNGKAIEGTWTMIYDQGFEVVLAGKKYFAFHSFKVLPGQLVRSYCSKTQKGWYHDEDGETNYGCYYGVKMNAKRRDVRVTKIVNAYLNTLFDKKFKNEKELVDLINARQKSWKAGIYPELEAKTIKELLMRSGYAKRKQLPQARRSEYEEMSDMLPVLKTHPKSYVDENITLPENWDWRNVSGENYVSDVRNQQACGSCYIFATIAVLESRIRIKTKNKVKPTLAPQEIVSCSLYSQLCHGGFPYLAAKYVQDFYLVPENCFPYKAEPVSCTQRCKNPNYRVRAKDYYYIGGFYGGSNERDMMIEIYKNGPIAVSYITYPDFSYYQGGVYHRIKGISGKEKTVNPWEPVTHSVAIVGWGVEPTTGEKYWIVKNSWGSWGENSSGFFRIRRGTDECSIESEAIAVDPEIEFYSH